MSSDDFFIDKKCCNATYDGLHKWFKHMFEHLGWMILAKAKGNNIKIESYKHSLVRLKKSLEQRIENMNDPDKRQDLIILHRDLMVLMSHIKIDFPQ